MSDLVKHIIRFSIFILIQVYVLNRIPPIHRFIVPYIYFLYILWLPFRTTPVSLMLIAFVFGITLDSFTQTPGLHAAACVLIAFIRPYLITIILPQERKELYYTSPSVKSLGGIAPYGLYVFVLTFIHHLYLILLEWLTTGNWWYLLGKVFATTCVSLLLIIIAELLVYRKDDVRANAL